MVFRPHSIIALFNNIEFAVGYSTLFSIKYDSITIVSRYKNNFIINSADNFVFVCKFVVFYFIRYAETL